MKVSRIKVSLLSLLLPAFVYSSDCSHENALVLQHPFIVREGERLMIFYGNGMKDVFENSNSGTEDEMGYCVTDYYPDFDAFILFEGTPQGNRFYWVNRISGQRAPVGFSRELSPALDRFVSVENGGCDDPREPRSVGVWNVSPGMVHNEFREAYKEFPKDTKECPYGAQWNGPNEIRVAFLTVPYPAKIIRSLVYKDNEWTWTTENEKRIGP